MLFDPRDPATDRWNPLWSDDTGAVVSRLVAPIAAGEGNARYYADLLQIHLGTVAAGLQRGGPVAREPAAAARRRPAGQLRPAAARWSRPRTAPDARDHARGCASTAQTIASPGGRRDLDRRHPAAARRRRRDLAQRADARPERGAVTLPAALAAGAVVLLRTWVDDLPDEARAITTLFLADAAAAALTLPDGHGVGGADRRVRRRALAPAPASARWR